MPPHAGPPELLWEFAPDSDCWEWQGNLNPKGYGKTGRGAYAHRWFWEYAVGSIPSGMTIDHLCKNKRCVNPDHLEVVTRAENTLRGDSPASLNKRKTHCPKGHALSGENLYRWKNRRQCKTCRDERNRLYTESGYHAQKQAEYRARQKARHAA